MMLTELPEYPLERGDPIAPEGAVPVVMTSMSFELSDAIVSTMVFFLAAQQRSELAFSPHYLAIVFLLLALLLLFNVIKRRLNELSARRNYTKHSLARFLIRLVMYAAAYVGGAFTGTLSDAFLSGPAVGVFSLWALLMPLAALALFLHLLFLLTTRGSPRLDLHTLDAE